MIPIAPIAPIGVTGPAQVGNVTSVPAIAPGATAVPAGGASFASQLDALSAMQQNTDQLAIKAATGDLTSIQDYTIASTEAQLMTQLTVTVRDKAVEAFNDIMKMQV
ncbi:MAG: flagellar hook-basal body complex subunit FliE [Ilumatobacteraceae bacterium]|nr:flagellar hook-basal body complex subunit FliE [Ilumatobacteraceae bacterium]MCU1387697.1 flagellar hook-basal body complex subunit FliE [Ilumatobacteraceae bacterium]